MQRFGVYDQCCLGRDQTAAAMSADLHNTKMITTMNDAEPVSSAGKSEQEVVAMLRAADLRPTRQRVALARLLFANGHCHVTAEMLHADAEHGGEKVSLATVYNTLHQFRRAGLLRELAIEGGKTYFDTNTSNHSHYFLEDDGTVVDIPADAITIDGLPTPPEGTVISHVDVVVRLKRRV